MYTTDISSTAAGTSNDSNPYVETDPSGRYGRVSFSLSIPLKKLVIEWVCLTSVTICI